MKSLSIELENCYGIRNLNATLDFSKSRAIAIYAPNGSMKTSLAQTFQDIAGGEDSKDRIFPGRVSKRNVKDENGADLLKDNVLVVRPYEEGIGHTAKTSTLLVNPVLRKEYEDLHVAINTAKDALPIDPEVLILNISILPLYGDNGKHRYEKALARGEA